MFNEFPKILQDAAQDTASEMSEFRRMRPSATFDDWRWHKFLSDLPGEAAALIIALVICAAVLVGNPVVWFVAWAIK